MTQRGGRSGSYKALGPFGRVLALIAPYIFNDALIDQASHVAAWRLRSEMLEHPEDMLMHAEDVVHFISPTPLLIMYGTDDPVVPASHSRKLLQLAGQPKEEYFVDVSHHNLNPNKEYHQRVDSFIKKHIWLTE